MRITFDNDERPILTQRLGLPADADTGTVTAAVEQLLTVGEVRPQGRQAVRSASDVVGRGPDPTAEAVIAAAVQAGKFSADRADHYRRRWAKDPQGTQRLIAKMLPGVVLPPLSNAPAFAGEAYDPSWLPEINGSRNRVTMGDH